VGELNLDYLFALTGTVVGGLIALAGVFYSNHANRQLWRQQVEKQDVDQKKLIYRAVAEDLYVNFSEWSNFIVASHMPLYHVMAGKIPYNAYLDGILESKGAQKYNHHRMEFLLRAYFPAMIADYSAVKNSLRDVNGLITEHKRQYSSNDPGTEFLGPLSASHERFEERCNVFKENLLVELERRL
jgi:hypothetical protein